MGIILSDQEVLSINHVIAKQISILIRQKKTENKLEIEKLDKFLLEANNTRNESGIIANDFYKDLFLLYNNILEEQKKSENYIKKPTPRDSKNEIEYYYCDFYKDIQKSDFLTLFNEKYNTEKYEYTEQDVLKYLEDTYHFDIFNQDYAVKHILLSQVRLLLNLETIKDSRDTQEEKTSKISELIKQSNSNLNIFNGKDPLNQNKDKFLRNVCFKSCLTIFSKFQNQDLRNLQKDFFTKRISQLQSLDELLELEKSLSLEKNTKCMYDSKNEKINTPNLLQLEKDAISLSLKSYISFLNFPHLKKELLTDYDNTILKQFILDNFGKLEYTREQMVMSTFKSLTFEDKTDFLSRKNIDSKSKLEKIMMKSKGLMFEFKKTYESTTQVPDNIRNLITEVRSTKDISKLNDITPDLINNMALKYNPKQR